jgi:hypothetical protein
MTSFTASSTAPMADSPLTVAAQDAAHAGHQQPARTDAQAQEFSSTAAVQVRGGWLFFQL